MAVAVLFRRISCQPDTFERSSLRDSWRNCRSLRTERLASLAGRFLAPAVHDVPRRLLPQAVPDSLPGLLLRSKRLLLQAVSLPRAREVLRPKRLLLQAPAAHSAALPDAELHLRPASELQLSA